MGNLSIRKYTEYLKHFINPDDICSRYIQLILILEETDFYSSNEYDDNRAADGLELRERFYDDVPDANPEVDGTFEGACKVFEMMVALAIRCEDQIMFDNRYGDRTAKWFWLMIDNLGLTYLDNRVWTPEGANYIKVVLEKCLDRRYGENGIGAFWPRPMDSKLDWRKLDIWYQMQYYLTIWNEV